MTDEYTGAHTSSQGHDGSDEVHLDRHFVFSRPEYEAMLKWVGLQPGWQVLDAGCGVGSLLPLMSELVGPSGQISAVDLAPENVEIVNARAAAGLFVCSVEARKGSIVELPYADNTFDALWSSNVTQYLTDGELTDTLAEFRRVLRSGGLLAIKDFDMTSHHFWPPGPRLMWRAVEGDATPGKCAHRTDST